MEIGKYQDNLLVKFVGEETQVRSYNPNYYSRQGEKPQFEAGSGLIVFYPFHYSGVLIHLPGDI